uniref:Sleeping Beauty transposase HTH domain-containing protein n=1 Tax=Oncorhynchus tshawytscha TaxID=74940 RepID=A0AAZ3PKP5_ONCTS
MMAMKRILGGLSAPLIKTLTLELFVALRDRIVSRHRSGEEYQNISKALKVPKNTVASIILKWKMFGTTKTLPRAGSLAKLSNRGRRALVREVNKYPLVALTKLQISSVEMSELSKRTTISAALHQSGLYDRVARRKAHDSLLGVCLKALKDSQTMRSKILWSDETKIELVGLNAKRHVWRKRGTIPAVNHGDGSINGVEIFFTGRNWETSQDRGKDEPSKVQRSLMKTCSTALRTSGVGSPSNRTMTLSTQPRQRRSGFESSL